MVENKKIRNARESVFNDIRFKSKLEESFYKTLVAAGLEPGYEQTKFVLAGGFKPTVPFFNRSKSKVFRMDMAKVRDITYTPDFIILHNGTMFIIEAKGIENDTFPLKKKLFRRLLESMEMPCVYFEVRTKRELLEVIKIIKSYGTTTRQNQKTLEEPT